MSEEDPKKNDMVLDPDGGTLQDDEGKRAILQVPPMKSILSQKYVMVGLVAIGLYGFIATIVTLFGSGRRTSGALNTKISPWDYHDGATYGYAGYDMETAAEEEGAAAAAAAAGDHYVRLEEPMVGEDDAIPPMLEVHYVDMFRFTNDGTMELTPYDPISGEYPVFWRIPTSGSRVESVLSACVKTVVASAIGSADEHKQDENLHVYNVNNRAYVNVDLSKALGIERAAALGLTESGLADVLISPHLHYTTNKLLSFPDHRGRLFTILRHPVERAIARHAFFIRQNQPDMPNAHPDLAEMTLVEYAQSQYSSKNWLTRFLVNKRTGVITAEDVAVAKEILRKKCLIGLYHQIEVSIERIERYFGWFKNNQINRECHANQIDDARNLDKKDYAYEVSVEDNIGVGSEVYDLLAKNNEFDMEVYWYAVALFEEQGKLFPPPDW